jgi:plastocyanin
MFRFLLSGGMAIAASFFVMLAPALAADQTPHRIIFVQDACDPATFNAMFGAGTCVRNGGITLPVFIDQLQRKQQAPLWRFIPSNVHVTTQDAILVQSIGGETHTFTEVAKFGGGFIPLLNQLSGNPIEAPECAAAPGEDNHFITAGASFVFTEGDPGTHLYECCIHPWMRAVLTVKQQGGRRGSD